MIRRDSDDMQYILLRNSSWRGMIPVMRIIADLHIHSRFSRATSKKLTPAYLDQWARIKGVDLVGTGDCTHPAWLSELKDQMEEAAPGLYALKDSVRQEFDAGAASVEGLPNPLPTTPRRFALTGEISTIYKKGGKTRKVHHLVLLPDFAAADRFAALLEKVGNIRSDGRPILGIDSRDLLKLLLDADDRALLIPAHIWTPWFSALGAKSGFDSIDECYGDLSSHITAVETGLSSNPPMNWALSSLDRFSIISNSDAHSPDKLGREATVFDFVSDLSFETLCAALRLGAAEGRVAATVEFYPHEGKYHYAGHRKCGVTLAPNEAAAQDGICPVCGKRLTDGVMSRVMELADRPIDEFFLNFLDESACDRVFSQESDPKNLVFKDLKNRKEYVSLIPLKEILGEMFNTGAGSKKVDTAYTALMERAEGGEIGLLMDAPLENIAALNAPGVDSARLAEGVARMRESKVFIQAGFDGEYGIIRVFAPVAPKTAAPKAAMHTSTDGGGLFAEADMPEQLQTVDAGLSPEAALPFDELVLRPADGAETETSLQTSAPRLSPEQERAVSSESARVLVIAGPGTGKTAVLAARIARTVKSGAVASTVLAVTFTVKAAEELRGRITRQLGNMGSDTANSISAAGIFAATFHSLCTFILREVSEHAAYEADAGIPPNFTVLSEEERERILRELCSASATRVKASGLGKYIEERKRFLLRPGEERPAFYENLPAPADTPPPTDPDKDALYAAYRTRLMEISAFDFDDLIAETARMFMENPAILNTYRERFRFIFVDEYQDVNFAQYALLQLLSPPNGEASLFAIGDPNQAIYAFRGADRRFIERFKTDYPDAAVFRLTHSFRCPAPVIKAANVLSDTEIQGAGGAALSFSVHPSEKSEAEAIARKIVALVGGTSFLAMDSGVADSSGNAAPQDCAVLVRAASLADPVAKALTDHGIPFILIKDQDELEVDVQGVRLMTMHAAKGLEFDHVFIPALEDGLLPFTLYDGKNNPALDERVAEEQRLLYVAMTRAKKSLYLSRAKKRFFQHRLMENAPSRFLSVLEPFVPLAEESPRRRPSNAQLSLF